MIQTNPFTPQSGLEPKFFSGREEALGEFSSLVDKSEKGFFSHILVLGEWGIGKTSLLRQFKKLAQAKGFWACFCSINKADNREDIRNCLNLIIEEILLGLPLSESGLSQLRNKFIPNQKNLFSLQIELAQFLLAAWQTLDSPQAFILLDDIQNFLPKVEILDILRATFSREDILRKTRFVLILSSTPEGWHTFLDKHDPIGRFFRHKIILGPFSKDQTLEFIEKSLKDTDVEFSSEVKENIFNYTQGHPYELQLICSHLFDAQRLGRVDLSGWALALRNTLRDLGSQYFDTLYNKASEREKDILFILAEKNSPLSLAQLRSIMILERRARSFPIANIKNFIYRLQNKGLIKKAGDASYSVLDPLFREYILRVKSNEAISYGA